MTLRNGNIMHDGSGRSAISVYYATLTIESGTYTGIGGGVSVVNTNTGCDFYMKGGTIVQQAQGLSCISSDGFTKMTGGTLINNSDTSDYYGGTVYVGANTFKYSAGTITNLGGGYQIEVDSDYGQFVNNSSTQFKWTYNY